MLTAPSFRGAAENSSSTEFIALRTSPPQLWAICSAAPGSTTASMPSHLDIMSTARLTAGTTSAGGTDLNSNTVLRESRAL